MALPLTSISINKKKKSSLALTLGTAGLLIILGIAGYWVLSQGRLFFRNLPVGANIIPGDAVFAISLSTNNKQWEQFRSFGTKETQTELDKNLVQLRDRFLGGNGFDFDRDIAPWVGEEVTIAFLAPEAGKPVPKPVADGINLTSQQSIAVVLPIQDRQKAQTILNQELANKGHKLSERTYKGITLKETDNDSPAKYSAAALDGRYLVITDNPKTTERVIDAYKGKLSLADSGSFAENLTKIATKHAFAQFYMNVPASASLTASSPKRQLPAQVLNQLRNNQGIAGTISLEPEGIRLRGVSWLTPNSQRLLMVENFAAQMQNRVPGETMMMLSGGNLQRTWAEYISTSQGNPLAPVKPEELRKGVKNLSNNELDLDRDLLSWMNGEFSISVVPTRFKDNSGEKSRATFVFMVQTRNRDRAEATMKKLDDIIKSQYQFQVQESVVGQRPVVNWIGQSGILTASRGWLDGNVAFLALGAPIADKILPKPNNTLASNERFQKSVPSGNNEANSKFFLDVESASTQSFPLPTLLPNQQALLEATRSIGMTSTIDDRRSTVYDMFVSLKKGEKPGALKGATNPQPTITSSPLPTSARIEKVKIDNFR